MNTLIKNCQQCGKEFEKNYYCSLKNWETTKFCGKECVDEFRKNKPSCSPATTFKKGQPCWNKGKKSPWFSGSNNPKWNGGRIEKQCENCKKKFKVDPYLKEKAKFCSRPCWGIASRGIRNSKATEFKPKYGIKNLSALKLKIRNCNRYAKWRKSIYRRDDFTCVLCHTKGGKLQVDHFPQSFSDILEKVIRECNEKYVYRNAMKCVELWELNNGRTLCKLCHFKTDNYGGKSIQSVT